MRMWCLLLSLFLSQAQAADFLKVSVIDSGLNLDDPRFKSHLCKSQHKDFTNTTIDDVIGHGTHIAGIIVDIAKNSPYCLVIIKYYDPNASDNQNTQNMLKSIQYATEIKSNVVNISGGGPQFQEDEFLAIQNSLSIFIVAAGNSGKELDGYNCYFPACYGTYLDNVISVGSVSENGVRSKFSNYGNRVKTWECGENVLGPLPLKSCDIFSKSCDKEVRASGTSQATAVHTGKYVYTKTH